MSFYTPRQAVAVAIGDAERVKNSSLAEGLRAALAILDRPEIKPCLHCGHTHPGEICGWCECSKYEPLE